MQAAGNGRLAEPGAMQIAKPMDGQSEPWWVAPKRLPFAEREPNRARTLSRRDLATP